MKLATCFASDPVDCGVAVEKMTQAMQLDESQDCGRFAVPGGIVGYVTTSERLSSVPLLRKAENGSLLMISGSPIDVGGSLDERLAEVVASDYRQASDLLSRMDGAFAALFWDAAAGKLVVVTDPLGLQPMYVARPGGRLLLASELKAFPASRLVAVEPDSAGWGAFVSLGFNIGRHTQLAGVSRVEAASVLVYDVTSGSLEANRHWSWPEPSHNMRLDDVDLGELLDAVRREIRSYTDHSRFGTVLLSGGFDSRLLLALLNEMGLPCSALILQHQDELFGTDGRYAARVAETVNHGDYELISPSRHFYDSSAFLRYLVMSEVAVPSLNLFIAQVSQYVRPEMKAVWEGLGPGFGFAPAYPHPGAFDEYLSVRCRPTDSLHWDAARSVFSRAMAQEMKEGFGELLRQEISRYPDDEFGVARFQMNNQMRRRLGINPTKVYGNYVLPFIPCASRAFWDLAARIPRAVTARKRLYMKLFKEHFPEALRVPICSNGSLYSPRTITPGFWTLVATTRVRKRITYYWNRMARVPVAGKAVRKLSPRESRGVGGADLVERVINGIDADHQDLNPDGVMAAKRSLPPYDWNTRIGRHLLFYWQLWRWVMEGRLTTRNAESFWETGEV